MRYFYLTFFCLFLLRPAPSYQDDRDDESDIVEDNSHMFNSVVNIPGDDSSGDEGNAESRPVVNHQRFKRKNGKLVKKRRRRRSAIGEPNRPNYDGDNRRIRYVDYNGWRPLDIVDPMLNEPTFIYKPPTLERVHFGEGPPEEKPMFPILPVNPTVYVVRAEAAFPAAKRHAIYGTENVDYLHINPQSNSAKVYSSFHEPHNNNNSLSNDNFSQNDSNIQLQTAKVAINANEITKKDVPSVAIRNTDNEYEIEDELESTTEESEVESTTVGENYYDLIHHTNEQLLENENIIHVSQDNKTSESDPLEWLKNPFYKFAEILRAANLTINEVENGTKIEENPKSNENSNQIKEEQQFADKSFTVGDDNYYYVYEDSDYEPSTDSKSTDFEDLMASSSDPFASIIPKAVQVSEEESEDPFATPDDPDENLETSGSQQVKETNRRAPLHERLKNFGGVQFDSYIFSASENEKQFSEPFPRRPSSFGFRTTPQPAKNLRSETGRKIGATTKGTNHREWYLIETRTEEPPPKKKKVESQNSRRNDFSDRYLSKYSDSPYIYNRYLDDHLKSFKPSEGLTANSLSELLQIFKYVTTPAPNQGKSFDAKDRRTFRYTKPTNSPRYTTAPPLLFTTFRYTIAEPDYPSYTELPFEDIGVLEGPLIVLNDSVAETNSLDGYLFSDSVASPEYKTLELQPNVIRFNPKEEALVRFDKIAEEAGKMDKHAVRRGELSPTLVIDAPKNSEKEKDSFDLDSSAYHIYEGHSKVKIFGSNVDGNGMNQKNDTKRAKSLTQNPYKFYDHLTTLPPGVVIRPIGTMSVHPSFKTRGAAITESTTSTQSTSATKSFSATLPPDVFTRSQYFGAENQRLSSVDNAANFNPAQKKAYLQSNNDESFIHFPTDFYDYFSLHGNDELSAKNNADDINIDVYPEKKLITHNFKYSKSPYPSPMPSERLLEEIPKTTTPESTERILDLSSLPSSIESFSKLILSYFSRNAEKEIPEKASVSLKEEKSEDVNQKQIDDEQENPKPEKKLDVDKEKAERSLTDYFSYLKSLEANK